MKITSKKKWAAALAMMCAWTVGMAQTVDYCKGLKNPTSFIITGNGNAANAEWYGFTGSKNATASQCGSWGMTGWGSKIPAAQLSSQSSGSSCTTANPPSQDINGQGDYMNRFVIKGSGYDHLTNNHLSYLPPDNSYTSSIRLGNNCGGTHEAEMLCYQLDVRPQNSLIFIWYALSLQNGQHTVAENPEFAIEIERRVGGASSNTWQRVGGDTLCYVRPTPAGNGANVSPFYVGSTGSQTSGASYGCNIYLPWNKVAINLNKYLYETVRIKIGAGDCSMSAHYACAYIAGECQPMEIKTSGCPAGSTQMVQKLKAPKGLENYVWYKSNSGAAGISSLYNVPDSINFTALTPATSTADSFECQISDFLLTEGPFAGTYTNEQVFRCDMTSRMNENIPFTSSVYVRVLNTKPSMAIDTLKTCDGDVTLTSKSYVPNDLNGCDTSITKWWFYAGSDTLSPIVDSTVGAVVTHRWGHEGRYAVKSRAFNRDDHECFSDSTYVVNVMGRPDPKMTIYPGNNVCAAERVIMQDTTVGSVRRDWYFYDYVDGQVVDSTIYVRQGNNDTISHVFTNYKNPIKMVTYNGLFTRDSILTYDTIWCTSIATDTVEVFQHPELLVSGDTVVCNGEQTDVTVSTETENCSYFWYLDTNDATYIARGQTLNVLPYDDTCRYYVKVVSPLQCEAWDSVNAYRVNPILSISRHDMCDGDEVTLTADNAFSYSWTATPPDSTLDMLLDSSGHGPQTITVAPNKTTVYTMVGHGTNDCNAAPLTEQITVHPVPEATVDAYPSFVDSDNPIVTLTDASPYSVHRVWYFDDGIAEEYTSPCSHNFGEVSSDSTAITLVAYNDLDCSDTLNFKLPVVQFTFYAPNVFTPERPDNSTFGVYTANEQENFSIYIYDRMGRLVYSSKDLHFAWDGTYEGQKLPQGAYTYVIRYRRPGTEDIVTQKGSVTLIR